jgi:hypothetical protein
VTQHTQSRTVASQRKSFRILMGSAASVASNGYDDAISALTMNDLCDLGFIKRADPSLLGIAANPLYCPSPTGLFDTEVPTGTIPGALFDISIDGRKFCIRCPPGKSPGDLISFAVGVASFNTALSGKQENQLISVQ